MPREQKIHEYRVALTPAGTRELTRRGHSVVVETTAGRGSGMADEDFRAAGAEVVGTAREVWERADLVTKVKEPVPAEYDLLRPGQVLFTYLHLAASPELTSVLMQSGTTAVAYETVQEDDGRLPLLAPMSEVAGRLAPLVGAHGLLQPHGGNGTLLSGVASVPGGDAVIIGGGMAGLAAAVIAVGLRGSVTLLDTDLDRLRQVDGMFGGRVRTLASTSQAIEDAVLRADLVVGAVLIPGASAPKLVSNELVAAMRPGSVLVDISIDQGGCFEDSRPTTHADPTYGVHESMFYCVANMPGAVPRTSTHALTSATLPHLLRLADQGWAEALRSDAALARGLNVHGGRVTNQAVAAATGHDAVDPSAVLDLAMAS